MPDFMDTDNVQDDRLQGSIPRCRICVRQYDLNMDQYEVDPYMS
jgi:hypothetical protein